MGSPRQLICVITNRRDNCAVCDRLCCVLRALSCSSTAATNPCALTVHELLLEGQVLPRADLISRQLIHVEAQVHPAARTRPQRLR